MRAPSLRGRVITAGVVVVAITMYLAGVGVYLSMRQELRADAAEVLQERVRLASAVAETRTSATDLIGQLARSGVPARATLADGSVLETDAVALLDVDRVLVATLPLPDGSEVEVMTSLARVDNTLRELALLLVLMTVFGVCLAALLLIRASRHALGPLDHMAATADAIARGSTGERLRPDRTDTDIGRLAAAFDAMVDAEEDALDQARATSELNRQFLADAAHQLRTPLAGLQATAELLAYEHPQAERERLLRNLSLGAQRVATLVDALLRMARIDQGEEPTLEPCDLLGLCREEAARIHDGGGGVELVVTASNGSLPAVPIDSLSMREAVGNLLDNACRYARARVELTLGQADGCAVLRVADDGPGMEEAAADRAFERFAVFGAGHGAGLGLPIARGVVEAHGGTLDYVDGVFEIRLPLDPA